MKKPVVIIGMGQMGGVFARGFLGIGHPVVPVLRETLIERVAEEVHDPAFVLVTVSEDDLSPILEAIPDQWKDCLGLLQNELLPERWLVHAIDSPTVIVVWFAKKFRRPVFAPIPSPIYGPHATLVADSLSALEIPYRIMENDDDLLTALVMKNVYILTINIAGLKGSETLGELLEQDYELVEAVFSDVLAIQESLAGRSFDREAMWQEVKEIFLSIPEHKARGRSAPQRLQRALLEAEREGVVVSTLHKIAEHIGTG